MSCKILPRHTVFDSKDICNVWIHGWNTPRTRDKYPWPYVSWFSRGSFWVGQSDQGKQSWFGWCWLICLLFAYMLERGECNSLLCNSHKLHNHWGFCKTANEVVEVWKALIVNSSATITTDVYEQIGIPRLNFQAHTYLKFTLNSVTVMLFISFLHVRWRVWVRTNEPVFTKC